MGCRPQSAGLGSGAARGSCVRATKSRGSSHSVQKEEKDFVKGMNKNSDFSCHCRCCVYYLRFLCMVICQNELDSAQTFSRQLFHVGKALHATIIMATNGSYCQRCRNYPNIVTLQLIHHPTAERTRITPSKEWFYATGNYFISRG